MSRQRLILFILVIFFVIAVIWSYSAIPRPKTAGGASDKAAKQVKLAVVAANKPANTINNNATLNMSLLDREMSGFKGYHRNIFKPVFVDELKVVKQKVVFKPPPPTAAVIPVVLVKTQPEPSPLARFTFLGFLKKGAAKTIFLSNDKNILLVKKGDRILNRYQATEITDQALTLTVTDTGDEIVIPLLENKPLTTAR